MNRWMIACICLFTYQVSLYAEERLCFVMDQKGKLFAIPTEQKYEWEIPKATYKSYIPLSEQSRLLQYKYIAYYQRFSEDISRDAHSVALLNVAESDRPANMHSLSKAYQPFFNPYTAMFRRMNPMALDYDELYLHPVSENTLFIANGIQETWPALGGMNILQTSLSHQIGNATITVGGFGGRYYTPYTNSPTLWGGINILLHYQVNDWMALKAWGSYAFYGDNAADPFLMMNPLLNRTNVGGAVEIKVAEHLKLQFGMNYQYDHFNKRMNRQFLFSPFGTNRSRFHMGF